MAEMLLINPRRRKAKRATRVVRARRAVTRRRNPIESGLARRRRSVSRRRNPISAIRRRVHTIGRARRRRNPISMGSGSKNIMGMFKEAAIGASGSILVDIAMGYINPMLPASMVRTPGTIGVGDAVKAGITVAMGHFLAKATKGASHKMALGALIVQLAEIGKTFVPASMTLGYAVPGNVVQGSARISPIKRGVSGYTGGGYSPLLNAYTGATGSPPLLSGHSGQRAILGAGPMRSMATREGIRR